MEVELRGPFLWANKCTRKQGGRKLLPWASNVALAQDGGIPHKFELEVIGKGTGRVVMGIKFANFALKLQEEKYHDGSNAVEYDLRDTPLQKVTPMIFSLSRPRCGDAYWGVLCVERVSRALSKAVGELMDGECTPARVGAVRVFLGHSLNLAYEICETCHNRIV